MSEVQTALLLLEEVTQLPITGGSEAGTQEKVTCYYTTFSTIILYHYLVYIYNL